MKAFQEIKAEIRKLEEQAKALRKGAFDEGSKAVFAAHPLLKSFSWSQYTPYFNDGEECVFGVHQDYPKVVFGDEEFEELSDWSFKDNNTYTTKERETVGLKEAYESIKVFLSSFDEDDYRECFGDHVEVTAKSPGVTEVEEYSHD